MKRIGTLLLGLVLTLAGCAPVMGPHEQGGTLLGAATGALAGSQIGDGRGRLVAVAIGSLAGALIGQGVGQSLDRADQLTMQRNARVALDQGRPYLASTWVNPDTGSSGSVTPVRTFGTTDGRYCREYLQNVLVGGVQQQAYGTACRQADGSWLIVANNPVSDYRPVTTVYQTRYAPSGYYGGYYYPWYYSPVRLFFSLGYFHHGHHGRHHLHGGHHFKGGHHFRGGNHFRGGHHFKGGHHFRGGHHFKGGHQLRGGGHGWQRR
ncbi:hypothetical protein DESUT3_13110 [Desulfuromonas versatilis]|uniref:17 kDa surface antigen n=1 Tax=Desulfuromonas versatilis TaxID=2802975 RepID=A0ABM8HUR8_9BACT|nr:RT0821/Lpp0805 family surface protein [Desulfuromonas versatilis]BCR04242.1 hypothetical protein DESUT3_13110 [Desulfuromonas versatilis]